MKKVAVVLSGCGFKDGAEITESVSTFISLTSNGAEYRVFAPNVDFESTNHLNEQASGQRNVLIETSRISRGQAEDIKNLKSSDFDALIFPGGFGAAKNLCNWAEKGKDCDINVDVARAINEFYKDSKPIGALCIAPVLIAKVLGEHGVTLTIGNDKETSLEIEKTGATHEDCVVTDYITDRGNKVVTTPAYMFEAKPHEVFQGISGLIKELVEMA